MSVDEQCQVKCCERHLMCFISECLNCPGTLESLSVNQMRRNETRLLSSEDTCLSAVTQANRGKRALQALWSTQDCIIELPCAPRITLAGRWAPWREDGGHSLEFTQTSNIYSSGDNNSKEQRVWLGHLFLCCWQYTISNAQDDYKFLFWCQWSLKKKFWKFKVGLLWILNIIPVEGNTLKDFSSERWKLVQIRLMS